MRWPVVAGGLLLILIIVGIIWYPARHPKSAPPPAEKVQSSLTNPYTERGSTYTISAAYPTTTPVGDAAAEEIQEWVIGEIGRFKDRIATGTASTLTITYEASSTESRASYLFTVSKNGVISTKAFTFNRSTAP